MWDGRPRTMSGPPPRAGVAAYGAAVAVTVTAVLSQYALPPLVPALRPVYGDLPADLMIVYGLPILAFVALVGTEPLRQFAGGPGKAAVEGLRWYGLLSLLSLLVTVVLVIAFLIVDPPALSRLNAPNPVLRAAVGDPWLWVGLSFLVGLLEETLFRGWIFGYWLARGDPRWLGHAVWTSALFVGVHVYYITTYGPGAGLILPMLFFLGLAFAIAMRYSGGNVLMIALLHGAFDASGFLSIVSVPAGLAFRYGLFALGLVVAGVVYLHRDRRSSPTDPPSRAPDP
ncbi:MAG TPA: CPBP family intramembrane glutamic endopeptidase [Thermoplasmata archaeon]|nr:CPBP family intramembrane glutamic endopeptidase [Thermoplasmata archaeon]